MNFSISKCSIHQFYTYSQGYIHKDIFTRIYLQGYTATSVNFCKISLVPLIICKLLFCHPFCPCDLFLKKEMDWSAWRILDNINVSDFLSGICLISSDACLRSHLTPTQPWFPDSSLLELETALDLGQTCLKGLPLGAAWSESTVCYCRSNWLHLGILFYESPNAAS